MLSQGLRYPVFVRHYSSYSYHNFRLYLIGWFSHYPFTTVFLHSYLTSGFVAPIIFPVAHGYGTPDALRITAQVSLLTND